MRTAITVVIDTPPDSEHHVATLAALAHAGAAGPVEVIRTPDITDEFIATFDGGVVIGPGAPYDRPDRAEEVIRSARERGVPLVGT